MKDDLNIAVLVGDSEILYDLPHYLIQEKINPIICVNTTYAYNFYKKKSLNVHKANDLKKQCIAEIAENRNEIKTASITCNSAITNLHFAGQSKKTYYIFDEFFMREKDMDLAFALKLYQEPEARFILTSSIYTEDLKQLVLNLSIKYKIEVFNVNENIQNTQFDHKLEKITTYPDFHDPHLYDQIANKTIQQIKEKSNQKIMVVVPNDSKIILIHDLIRKKLSVELGELMYHIILINVNSIDNSFDSNNSNNSKNSCVYIVNASVQFHFYNQHQIDIVIDSMVRYSPFKSIDESINEQYYWSPQELTLSHAKNYIMITDHKEKLIPQLINRASYYDILDLLEHKIPAEDIYEVFGDERIRKSYKYQHNYLSKSNFLDDQFELYHFCSQFPLSIRKASILYYIRELDTTYSLLLLSIICSLEYYSSRFFIENKNKTINKYTGYSILDTLTNVWIDIYNSINPFNKEQLKKYCLHNDLSYSEINPIIDLIQISVKISAKVHYQIYYASDLFQSIDLISISSLLYYLIALTYIDYETYIYPGFSSERCRAICTLYTGETDISDHHIDKKAIHNLKLYDMSRKCYILVREPKISKKDHKLSLITMLHTIDYKNTHKAPSIFSSEI